MQKNFMVPYIGVWRSTLESLQLKLFLSADPFSESLKMVKWSFKRFRVCEKKIKQTN